MTPSPQPSEIIRDIAALSAVLVALAKLSRVLARALRGWWHRHTLASAPGAELFGPEEIRKATQFYIQPDCQNADPSASEDLPPEISIREPLLSTAERLLEDPGKHKYIMLLADSGMGKTSFLLNYYAHRLRQRRRRNGIGVKLIPLNVPNADDLIKEIPGEQRSKTILLLDAFDEDHRAIEDHRLRISELIDLTREFRTVVITCRSQFFPKDDDIMTGTGVLKVGPVQPNEPRVYFIRRLYLSPFTRRQIHHYLKKKFRLYNWRQRRAAFAVARKIADLANRPILLAHIEDLVKSDKPMNYAFQIYEALIDAWLVRERGLVDDEEVLRGFCEVLAVDIFLNRKTRGMERIPAAELEPLAARYKIPLTTWQVRGRSLLNRDAVGNYKFAHRSMMEYLFAKQFAAGKVGPHTEPWTGLIQRLFLEMVRSGATVHRRGADLRGIDLRGADYKGVDLSGTDLRGAELGRSRLDEVNFRGADLSGAVLAEASLTGADLSGAVLAGVDFRGADLSGVDLSAALSLTQNQIDRADGDEDTVLHAGLRKPDHWFKEAVELRRASPLLATFAKFLTSVLPRGAQSSLVRTSSRALTDQLRGQLTDQFLEMLLRSMELAFELSNDYRRNIEGFRGTLTFVTRDGSVGISAVFGDGRMKVLGKPSPDWQALVRYKDSQAMWSMLLGGGDILFDSLLNNTVEVEGNLNYIYRFGFLARDLQRRLGVK